MKKRNKIIAGLFAAVLSVGLLAGCSDAQVVSDNLSTAADQFEIDRKVTFINGFTDTILFEIEGKCSIEDETIKGEPQLEVTCKIGSDEYVKHFLGLSDNVTYVVEQTEFADADEYHYRFIIKPEVIIPDLDIVTGVTDPGD